jgi:hypothetical protein
MTYKIRIRLQKSYLDAIAALSLHLKDDVLMDKCNYHHKDGVVLEILSFSKFGARCHLRVAQLFCFSKALLKFIAYANLNLISFQF